MSLAINVAIGIVCYHGRILIAQRRSATSLGGYWEFPGGKVEPGETVEQCLIRELKEELGILIHPFEALETTDFEYADKTVRLWPYLCDLLAGNPRPLASEQVRWITAADLGTYHFPPANDQLLRRLAARFA